MTPRALYLPVLVVLLHAVVCQGQTAATPEVGANPFKSYSGGDIDHIQMQNGSLYLRIPLLSYPQKGKLSLSFSLLANGSQWQEYGWCDATGDCDYEYASGLSISMLCPTAGGWPGGGPASVQVVVDQDLSSYGCTNEDSLPLETYSSNSYSIIDSSQAIHPLGYNQNNWSQMQATDGSGYTFISPCVTSLATAAIGPPASCDTPSTIYDSGGVKHFYNTVPSGGSTPLSVLTFQDPAGNSIARATYTSPYFAYDNIGVITDSAGRTIPDPMFLEDEVSQNSVPLSPSTSMCPNLGVPGQSAQGSIAWTVPGYGGSTQTQTYYLCYTNMNIATNFFGSGPGGQESETRWGTYDDGEEYYESLNWDDAKYTIQVLQSVVLPNNTYWGFVYDSASASGQAAYGDLLKVILPSGGSLNYTYATIPACGSTPGEEGGQPYTRAAATRSAQPLTGSPISSTYAYFQPTASGGSTAKTIETDAYGNDTVHIFTLDYPSRTTCGAQETSTQWYQGTSNGGTNGVVLKEEDTTYTNQLQPQGPSDDYYSFPEYINVLPETRKIYLNGQLINSITYGYDTLFTDVQTYYDDDSNDESTWWTGIGTTSATISLETPTSVSDSISKTATTRYAVLNSPYQTANMLELPGIVKKYDPSGNLLEQITYGYDESPSPQGVFGNQTSVTKNYGVKTSTVYNNYAMPIQTTDANGNAGLPGNHTTYFSYEPTGLYVTEVQAPVTNVPHNRYFQQDYNTGLVTAASDENASSISDTAHTVYYIHDQIGRLTQVNYPDGGQVIQCYTDEGGASCGVGSAPFSVLTQRKQSSAVNQNSSVEYDGLGRRIQAVDAAGAIVSTTYDLNGNAASVSNPYYSSNGLNGVTSYVYDALGRKTFQCQPDNVPLDATTCNPSNSYQSWIYNEGVTTFSDEDTHSWQRTSDAHNRLVQVIEPGSLVTNYSYDALDNLLAVKQLGNGSTDVVRSRTFNYDALSRLSCASNPESSTAVCPSSYSGSYTSGTTGYTYDPNGNVITKEDARGITITYGYDALNRLLGKSYSDGVTPYSCLQYDALTTPNSIGRLSAEWTVPGSQSSGCVGTAPTTGFITMRQILAYDAMGRVLSEQQCTPNASGAGNCTSSSPNPFALSYLYDLAGNPTGYTNGVSNVPTVGTIAFGLQYDGAGRLQNLSSSWNPSNTSSASPIQLFTADPTSGYTPAGAIQNMVLGSNIFVNKTYDNRLRTTSETATHP